MPINLRVKWSYTRCWENVCDRCHGMPQWLNPNNKHVLRQTLQSGCELSEPSRHEIGTIKILVTASFDAPAGHYNTNWSECLCERSHHMRHGRMGKRKIISTNHHPQDERNANSHTTC